MPLPFALTLPQLIAALGVGGVAVAAATGGSPTLKTIKATRLKSVKKKGTDNTGNEQDVPTGPLPAEALAAYNSPKKGKGRSRSAYGPKNDIHKKGSWFRFATYSDKWDRKLNKLRYYSGPRTGALYVRKAGSTAKVGNLCWMARCPDGWYPGKGKAKALNCRVPGLTAWLGPKADWKTLSSAFKTSIKNIPAVLKAAGVVVAGIYSGGASVQKNPEGQLKTVGNGIKGVAEPYKDMGNESDARLGAARALITGIRKQYILQMMDANPWAVKDGKLDIGKHYMADPKTWEDLGKPGKSRPLLFNPPKSK